MHTLKGILNYSKKELNLKASLKGGQSFRWTELNSSFYGVIRDKIFQFNQNDKSVEYIVYYNTDLTKNLGNVQEELIDYFHLEENLQELYSEWSKRDEKFKNRIDEFGEILNGIRVLKLDPVENLFSFICSSNNNIKRITQMVNNMCIHFGNLIGEVDQIKYYTFPTIDRLSQSDVESKLRQLNFGYRAKFIHQAAVYIKKNYQDERWLFSLRDKDYFETVTELVKIPGIGKKVADCISLMSLNKLEAIPVDTHVLNLARNLYNFVPINSKKSNSLSEKSYKEIADSFRNLWGKYAGWAQTVMFIDDLTDFKKEKILIKSNSFKLETNDKTKSLKRSNSDLLSTPNKNVKKSKSKI